MYNHCVYSIYNLHVLYVIISTHIDGHIRICVCMQCTMHTSAKRLFMTVKGLSTTFKASANVSLDIGLLIIVNMLCMDYIVYLIWTLWSGLSRTGL